MILVLIAQVVFPLCITAYYVRSYYQSQSRRTFQATFWGLVVKVFGRSIVVAVIPLAIFISCVGEGAEACIGAFLLSIALALTYLFIFLILFSASWIIHRRQLIIYRADEDRNKIMPPLSSSE